MRLQPAAEPPVGADLIPRRALLGGAGVLLAVLGLTAAARLSGRATRDADARVVARRTLRFIDRPDHGVAVVDGASGDVLEVVHGEQGFLRGTLRGLARERRRRGIGSAEPLLLTAFADGRLALSDPTTDQRIDLESFGPSNAAVYARWLHLQPPTRKTP
jgi:putative photosynthetic complex assembly protein